MLVSFYLRRRRNDLMTDQKLLFRYGLLYSGYSYSEWWWEIVVFLRKLLVIIIITFASGDELQLHYTWITVLSLLFIQERYKPFHESEVENNKISSKQSRSRKKRSSIMRATIELYSKQMSHPNLLHKIEVTSMLVLIFMIWSAIFFKDSPYKYIELCAKIVNRDSCESKIDAHNHLICHWSGQVCTTSGLTWTTFLSITLVIANFGFLLIAGYKWMVSYKSEAEKLTRKASTLFKGKAHALRKATAHRRNEAHQTVSVSGDIELPNTIFSSTADLKFNPLRANNPLLECETHRPQRENSGETAPVVV